MAKKLTGLQAAVLQCAVHRGGPIDYYDAAHLGANGKTLHALCQQGYMLKEDDRGTNRWRITDAGHQELARALKGSM